VFLQDSAIFDALRAGDIAVVPPSRISPASIELRVGTSIARPLDSVSMHGRAGIPRRLSELSSDDYQFITDLGEGDTIVIDPLQFVLVATLEWVRLGPAYVGFVQGKSTTARARVMIECAGLVDPGYEGRLTLEVFNLGASPVILTVGEEVAQIAIAQLLAPARRPYGSEGIGSRYQGDQIVAAPKRHRPIWMVQPTENKPAAPEEVFTP
jgi:dCTP deaminase